MRRISSLGRLGVALPFLLALGGPAGDLAAQTQVSGVVMSSADGSPLSGARVVVKGTSVGTLTGTNGRYVIAAPSPGDTLVVSYIGFRAQEVGIAGRSAVNVSMEPLAILMDEVVVTGYGTQLRRDVTGAVASLDAEDLPPLATSSVDQLLQGSVAGVQVTASSGRPGDSVIVRIRGVGTLNDASPLYVVDGMLLDDIAFLSPSDLASVEVLKDASATAIYGSRGANGVIIVTTKRGAIDRPTRFSFNAYAGTQSVLDPIKLVNAQQYGELANEYAANVGLSPFFPNPGVLGVGTDWQDLIFEPASIQNYQLSSSGGTDKITYYFSGNYFRQAGVISKSDFNRLTVRLNNDYRLTGRLLFGHNISFSYTDGQRPPGVVGALYRADPAIGPTNPDGSFSDVGVRASAGNPAATIFYTRNEEQGARLVGNVFAELNLLDRFTLRSSFGLDHSRTRFRSFTPVYFVSPTQNNVTSDLLVQTGTTNSWLWENTLSYTYASERHRLSAVAGVTAQSFYLDSLGCGRENIVGESENFWFCNAGDAAAQTNFNGAFDWKMFSYLFRTNYTYRDRYLFTGSLRVDGSSRFGDANRYGYFPSLALGWNLKEESFLQGTAAITALKLRASWGKIGNDKIGAYPAVAGVTGNLNAVFGPGQTPQFGQTVIRLANPDVKWERTTQTNIGADMAFWDGRLEATLDYYRRVTDGILVEVPIPTHVGVDQQPFVNAAEVLNTGVEGTFTWRRSWGDLNLDLGLNGATINNKVRSLAEGKEQILGGGLGNEITSSTRTVPGQPIGCFWGLKVLGVFQTAAEIAASPNRGVEVPGDLRYADLNGRDPVTNRIVPQPDGVVNGDDATFIGCPIPDVVYGFNGRLTWGSFDVSAGFSGQAGNKVFNGKKAVRFGVENFEQSFLTRWHGQGTSDREPRVTNAGHNYLASDRFIESGSFLKLHSVQLGYRLPPSVASALRVQQARIYVNGTNVLQFTDYSGYTPELTGGSVIASNIDLGVFPPARTVTFGLDITF